MKMPQIIQLIAELAKSQGFYGRLLEMLKRMALFKPDEYALLRKDWEARNFKNALDFITYIES